MGPRERSSGSHNSSCERSLSPSSVEVEVAVVVPSQNRSSGSKSNQGGPQWLQEPSSGSTTKRAGDSSLLMASLTSLFTIRRFKVMGERRSLKVRPSSSTSNPATAVLWPSASFSTNQHSSEKNRRLTGRRFFLLWRERVLLYV